MEMTETSQRTRAKNDRSAVIFSACCATVCKTPAQLCATRGSIRAKMRRAHFALVRQRKTLRDNALRCARISLNYAQPGVRFFMITVSSLEFSSCCAVENTVCPNNAPQKTTATQAFFRSYGIAVTRGSIRADFASSSPKTAHRAVFRPVALLKKQYSQIMRRKKRLQSRRFLGVTASP